MAKNFKRIKIPNVTETFEVFDETARNDLASFKTETASNLELKQNVTDNTLNTTAKTIPAAINELVQKDAGLKTDIDTKQNKTDSSLNTENKTIVAAINELVAKNTSQDARIEEVNNAIPTKTSTLTNDSDFTTKTEVANTYTKKTDIASSSAAGLVKIGYEESGKNYPVELNTDNQMFVNVPWEKGDEATWANVSGKPFSSIGDNLSVSNDKLDVDTTKIATVTALSKKLDESTFNTYKNTTAPNTYVAKDGFKTTYLDGNSVAYQSDLTDKITKDVTNLTNYYDKTTVDNLHADLQKNSYQVVATKPTTGAEGITYLVGTAAPYEMWVYETTQGWIDLGSTTIDLSNYVQGSGLTSDKIILGNAGTKIKASSYGVATTLGTDDTTLPTSKAVQTALTSGLSAKQNTLTAGNGIIISDDTISTNIVLEDYVI